MPTTVIMPYSDLDHSEAFARTLSILLLKLKSLFSHNEFNEDSFRRHTSGGQKRKGLHIILKHIQPFFLKGSF
jgi:hypothetical protein